MAVFNVVVTRTNVAESTYRVEADTLEGAELKVEAIAADDDWTGRSHCVEYEAIAYEETEPMRYETKVHPDGGWGCWDTKLQRWSKLKKEHLENHNTEKSAQSLTDYCNITDVTMQKVFTKLKANPHLVHSIAAKMNKDTTVETSIGGDWIPQTISFDDP